MPREDRAVPGLPDENEAAVGVSTTSYCCDRRRSPPRRSKDGLYRILNAQRVVMSSWL
jgi:hypothetical protein